MKICYDSSITRLRITGLLCKLAVLIAKQEQNFLILSDNVSSQATALVVSAGAPAKVAQHSTGNGRKFRPFDKQPHSPLKCPLSLEETLAAVPNEKLCFRCLRANHGIHNCKVDRKCERFNNDHHTAICKQKPATGAMLAMAMAANVSTMD